MGILYEVKNTINGNIYVGITTRPLRIRQLAHYSDARKGKEGAFQRALRKHGHSAFAWRTVVTGEEWYFLCVLERLLIDEHRKSGATLYNLTDGGEGNHGYIPSAEARAKISVGNRGKKCSEETRKRLSEAGFIRKHSAETKQRIREFRTGKSASDATKERMRASQDLRRKQDKLDGITRQAQSGEDRYNSIFTENDVLEIIRMMDENMTIASAMQQFKASFGAIESIKNGRTWKHLSLAPSTARKKFAPRGTKLSESDVQAILARLANGDVQNRIAEDFGVSAGQISMIKHGLTRRHLTG